MKTLKTIKSDYIAKRIEKEPYFDIDSFNISAKRFCKALKEGRMIATVTKVSASGMRRYIKIVECHKHEAKGENRYYTLNFCAFLSVLGYRINDNCEIVMNGCGMDMIYSITSGVCDTLHYLGALSDKEYKSICGKQANVI